MFKNVASQKWVVFAFDITDGSPKTGDAAQITGKISLDHATPGAIGDTNPTEIEDGYYVFDLTQGETDADHALILPESSTSNIQVVGVPGAVFTRPPNFTSLGIESDGDLTKVNALHGQTVQTEDHTAGIAAIPTTAMRGTDSAALASALVTHDGKLDTADALIDTLITRITAAIATKAEMDTAHGLLATPAEVNAEVADVLKTDVISEQAQGVPPTTPTFEEAVMYLYMALTKSIDVDATLKEFRNSAGTVVWKKALSDDGTNYVEAKGASGP